MAAIVKKFTHVHLVLPQKLDIHVSVGLKNQYKIFEEVSFECGTGNRQLQTHVTLQTTGHS